MRMPGTVVCSAIVLLLLQGCSSPGHPLSLQTKLLGCAGAIVGTALLGSQRGATDRQRGAVQGAVVGAVGCGIWLLVNNDDDEKVAALQTEALRTQQPQQATWSGPQASSEQQRTAMVSVTPPQDTTVVLKNGSSSQQVCSTVSTQIRVGGESTTQDQLWCKGNNGEFEHARGQALAAH